MVWGLAAALAAGVWYEWHVFWILPAALILCFITRTGQRWRCLLWFTSAGLLFMYGHFTATVQENDLAWVKSVLAAGGGKATFRMTGWVSGFPQTGLRSVRFRFRTELAGRPVDVIVYTRMPGLDYGDSLQFECRPLKRRGAGEGNKSDKFYLMSKKICATVRVVPKTIRTLPGHNGRFLNRHLFWPVHNELRQRITRRLGSRSGIPLALLLGEKGYLDKQIKRIFVDLGISHLLALSGMHLGLVAGAILIVFLRLGVRSYLALWLVLSFYVGMVGEVVSLHRAYVMASFMIAAKAIQRSIDPVMSLGNAVFLILLWAPWTLLSVGFQLSFVATRAVLICVRRISIPRETQLLRKIWRYSVSTIVVGIFVQLFLSPLLTLHFGRLSAVSPVATLVFFPFVLVVLFLSFLCSITSVVSPGAGIALAPLLDAVVSLFRFCLLAADDLSPRLLRIPQMDVLLTWAGICLIWQWHRPRLGVPAGLVLIALSFLKPLNLLHKFLMQ